MSDDNENANVGAMGSFVVGIGALCGVWVSPEHAQAIGTIGMIVLGSLPSWVKMVRGK